MEIDFVFPGSEYSFAEGTIMKTRAISYASLSLAILALLPACATSSSDLKPNEVPKDHRVIFGHVDVYNGDDKFRPESSKQLISHLEL
jgi:hypothetical protein